MNKEEIINDLEFLKEIKENVDEMANSFNLTNIQHVQTMINDWIDELEEEEPNNGWIKIESEADLPKEDCKLHVYPNYLEMDIFFFYNDELSRDELITNHTHYQPIEKPKPPIY